MQKKSPDFVNFTFMGDVSIRNSLRSNNLFTAAVLELQLGATYDAHDLSKNNGGVTSKRKPARTPSR